MRGLLEAHLVLLERQVQYDVVRLPARVTSADALPAVLGLAPADCVAVRVFHTDDGPVAALVQAGQWPDHALLAAALRFRGRSAEGLRRATRDETNSSTDFQAGLVSPLALPDGVLVLADIALLRSSVVYVPTGDSGTALGTHTRDLLTVTGAQLGVLTRVAAPQEPAGAQPPAPRLAAPTH